MEGSRGQGLSSGLLPGRDGGQPRAGTVQWVVAGTGGRAAEGRDCPVGCCRDGMEGSRGQGLSSGLLPGREGGQPRAGTVQWVVAGTGGRAGTVQWVVAGTGGRAGTVQWVVAGTGGRAGTVQWVVDGTGWRAAAEGGARTYRGWSRDRAG